MGRNTKTKSEMKKDDLFTADYFKRLGATSVLDFMRFNALVSFEKRIKRNSSSMSRLEYALLLSESTRDVIPEILKKKMEENKKCKKEMERGDDESINKSKKKME